jgi:hypothetical protein
MGNSVSNNFLQLSIRHLATRPVEDCDDEFWSRFTSGQFTPEQIKTLLNTTELETIRGLQPKNFKLLVLKLVWKLQSVLQNGTDVIRTPQAMTCVYILTRLAPIALQNPGSGFSTYVFWSDQEHFGTRPHARPNSSGDPPLQSAPQSKEVAETKSLDPSTDSESDTEDKGEPVGTIDEDQAKSTNYQDSTKN